MELLQKETFIPNIDFFPQQTKEELVASLKVDDISNSTFVEFSLVPLDGKTHMFSSSIPTSTIVLSIVSSIMSVKYNVP
jgi:hypothetical protein